MSPMLKRPVADQLRGWIVHNDFRAVFEDLLAWAAQYDLTAIRDLVLSLQSQYEAFKRKEIMGVLSHDQANITLNMLRANLLDMISRLEKGDTGLAGLSFNFGPGGTTIHITQIHHGSGDNVGGDKTEHH